MKKILAYQSKELQPVLRRAAKLARLQPRVNYYLDPELAPHCKVANLRRNRLILAVDSAAYATRLRFYLPQLLKQLQQQERLTDINGIDIKIVPQFYPTHSKPYWTLQTPSPGTLAQLEQSAGSIADEQLASAFRGLLGALKARKNRR